MTPPVTVDRVPRRPPVVRRRLLVLLAVLVPLVAGAPGWPRTAAVFTATTDNNGNGIRVSGCLGAQLLRNPGFETGARWAGSYDRRNDKRVPGPKGGRWHAVLRVDSDTNAGPDKEKKKRYLAQTVWVPTNCARATLSFWLHVQTFVGPGTSTMRVQLRDPVTDAVMTTLATFSHTDASPYRQLSYDLTAYRGLTVTVRFDVAGTGVRRTDFAVDETAFTISTP